MMGVWPLLLFLLQPYLLRIRGIGRTIPLGKQWTGIPREGGMGVRIGVKTLGGYSHGGNEQSSFEIRIDYQHSPETLANSYLHRFDLREHKNLVEELERLLLGKKSPVELKGGFGNEPIVDPGDTISRLHFKTILEYLDSIDFDRTPWAEDVNSVKQRYFQQEFKRRVLEGEEDVIVTFTFPEGDRKQGQKSGFFSLTTSTARLLGQRLMKASKLQLKENEKNIQV
jgi:hypothetical protein